ncbi:hypothetical protein FRC16_005770, partial [Serendipita sp. 398]
MHVTTTVSSSNPPPNSTLQAELKLKMRNEIGNQTFQFPADTIAKMLSPKRLLSTYVNKRPSEPEHPSLDDHDFLIEQQEVEAAFNNIGNIPFGVPKEKGEKPSHPPLEDYFNRCIQACKAAYENLLTSITDSKAGDSKVGSSKASSSQIDGSETSGSKVGGCKAGDFTLKPRSECWFPELTFYSFNRPTCDGIDDAHSLKPDLVAMREADLKTGFGASWSDPKSLKKLSHGQIQWAVESKRNWPEMVQQAGTYARALRSTCPGRVSRLVFAHNCASHTFRLLVFHDGGLTATMLWQDAEDAGFPCFTNGVDYNLPYSKEQSIEAKHMKTLWHSKCSRGRGTYVALLRLVPSEDDNTKRAQPPSNPPGDIALSQSSVKATDDTNPPGRRRNPRRGTAKSGSGSSPASTSLPQGTQQHSPISGQQAQVEVPEVTADPKYFKEQLPKVPVRVARYAAGGDPFEGLSTCIIKMCSPSRAQQSQEIEAGTASSDRFGVCTTVSSFQAVFASGRPVSNSFLLPDDNTVNHHWSIFSTLGCPSYPDVRPKMISIIKELGRSLEECETPFELCECILHAVIGWFELYQSGSLHRDLSIGNILKLVEPRLDSTPSIYLYKELQSRRKAPNPSDGDVTQSLEALTIDPKVTQKLDDLAEKLQKAINDLKLTQCKSMVSDFDQAAQLATYFKERSVKHTLYGTREFMSTRLLDALRIQTPIL